MPKNEHAQAFTRGIQSLCQEGFGIKLDKPLTKKEIIQSFLDTFFKISSKMFEIKGLPNTIPSELVLLKTQLYGFQVIDKVGEDLYSFYANLGGELDYNYQPTTAIISNPWLKYSASRTIDKDCILVRNDYLMTGLYANHKLFATNIADVFITLNKSLINARVENIPTATNSNQAEAWGKYFKDLEEGNSLGAIVDSNFFKDVKSLPFNTQAMSNIKATIEAFLFLKGSFFNSIGLQASFNAKREYVSEAETGMNDQTLAPSLDEMFDCQKKGWEKVNAMYGTNITIDWGSEWKKAREEKELAKKVLENEANGVDENKEEGGEEDEPKENE
jgi:hypothetical protein